MADIKEIKNALSLLKEEKEQALHAPSAFCLAVDLSIEALQEKLERETPKPLTLEELKQMEGEPVYHVDTNDIEGDGWYIVNSVTDGEGNGWLRVNDCIGFRISRIKSGEWKFYRHKPADK